MPKKKKTTRVMSFTGKRFAFTWAKALLKYGTQTEIARAMGHPRSAISMWKAKNEIQLYNVNHIKLLCSNTNNK